MCPEIEEQLIKWIEVVRAWKIPLTIHAIQVCALQLFSERNESNEKSFKASRGCLMDSNHVIVCICIDLLAKQHHPK